MRTLILSFILIFAFASLSLADTFVRGYYRKDGTYVQPHYRSSPNSTTLDNWSTKGNVNPYTGKQGTRNPDGYGYDNSSYGTNNIWGRRSGTLGGDSTPLGR